MSEYRVEKVIACPRDGYAIARIAVKDGRRCLVLSSGRDGHTTSLQSRMTDARREWENHRELISTQMGETFYSSTLGRLEDDATRAVGERVIELPSPLDIAARDSGTEPVVHTAYCRRCHTPTPLTVLLSADGSCTVLM